MKQLILVGCLMIGVHFIARSQTTPGETIASKISYKMKDSLSLSQGQQDSIYLINLDLLHQKQAVWAQTNNPDSLTRGLQLIENTRDSLYKQILQPSQYLLYRDKKTRLVNNN